MTMDKTFVMYKNKIGDKVRIYGTWFDMISYNGRLNIWNSPSSKLSKSLWLEPLAQYGCYKYMMSDIVQNSPTTRDWVAFYRHVEDIIHVRMVKGGYSMDLNYGMVHFCAQFIVNPIYFVLVLNTLYCMRYV